MKEMVVIFFVGFSSLANAQFNHEEQAMEWMASLQFSKAQELWSYLATQAPVQSSQGLRYAQQAIYCSEKAGDFEHALFWSQNVTNMNLASLADLQNHVKLLRRLRSAKEVRQFLSTVRQKFPEFDDYDDLVAFNDRIEEIEGDSIDCFVGRLRPHATAAEYAVTPYGEGLLFCTTEVGAGIAPFKDGWSDSYFTDIRRIKDPLDSEQIFSFWERLRGEDLFVDFGKARRHDGPVDFNQKQTFAVLTRNQTQLNTFGEGLIARLELEFFRKRSTGWEPATPFPWNSGDYSCGHAVFDANGDVIFASDMPGGLGGMDLYHARWENDDWSKPMNLGSIVNSAGNEVFPFVSEIGNLYFASDGFLGLGGLEIFALSNGSNQIERLGAPINSPSDDFGFRIDERKGEGWLSSNRQDMIDAIYRVSGFPKAGQVEVEVRACDGTAVSNAVVSLEDLNTGLIRTERTDENGRCAMFGTLGRDYELMLLPFRGMNSPPSQSRTLSDSVTLVILDMSFASKENTLIVLDEHSQPMQNAFLKFEKSNGESAQFVTDSSGHFDWSAPSQAEDFVSVVVTSINYQDNEHVFDAPPPGCLVSIRDTLRMLPWDDSVERIDLKNVLYDLGSAVLRMESKVELDKLVQYMKKKVDIRVELSSHTDCRDDRVSNMQLSQSRAENCVAYIIGKGISNDRIIAKGYGETRLLNSCSDQEACGCAPPEEDDCMACSDALHQQNRRTELRLLAKEE
jgi:outer membrane protein OmpA-like peptidoglycan-associated protein